jgi:predicted nucleic acid-binding Zn ribbon protein
MARAQVPSAAAVRRRRALAEWRGYTEPRASLDRVQPLSVLVGKAVQDLGLGQLVREDEVIRAWRELVGDFLASHSAPGSLRDGVLYVRVLQSTVHFELERVWRPKIMEKLRARFGPRVVRELKFRLG